MKQTLARTSTWIVAVALAAACGEGDGMDDAAQMQPCEDDAASDCPPGTPEFVTGPSGLIGVRKPTAPEVQVRLDDADSEPPEKDYNTWALVITDLAGAPLPKAQVTWACAWMPAHGHGVNPKAIERLPDGRISLVKQNLSMNGGWQVRLWVDPTGTAAPFMGGSESRNPDACKAPSNAPEDITFDVCVPRESGAN